MKKKRTYRPERKKQGVIEIKLENPHWVSPRRERMKIDVHPGVFGGEAQ